MISNNASLPHSFLRVEGNHIYIYIYIYKMREKYKIKIHRFKSILVTKYLRSVIENQT